MDAFLRDQSPDVLAWTLAHWLADASRSESAAMNARMLNSDVNILVMSYCNCIDASKKSSPCVATNMPYGISVNACMLCHAATCSGMGKERCSTAIALARVGREVLRQGHRNVAGATHQLEIGVAVKLCWRGMRWSKSGWTAPTHAAIRVGTSGPYRIFEGGASLMATV